MKNLFPILLLAIIFNLEEAPAQNVIPSTTNGFEKKQGSIDKEVNKVRCNDFFIYLGDVSQINPVRTVSDFILISPNSNLLTNDFSDFRSISNSEYNSSFFYGDGVLSMGVSLSFRDANKKSYNKNTLLRLGLTYCNATKFGLRLSKEGRFAYDTLISALFSTPVYIDSINTEIYNINYWADQIRLDCSLIFRSKIKSRLTLHSGIGFNLGISSSSVTTISYSNSTFLSSQIDTRYSISGLADFNSVNIFTEERRENNLAYGFATYIPLGLDFGLGKAANDWGKLNFFGEFRPGLNYYWDPNLNGNLNPFIQYGMGLRVKI